METRDTFGAEEWPARTRALRRLAEGLLRGGDGVEDLLQEAWLRSRGRPQSLPWWKTVLRNLARDRARALGRRAQTERGAARAEAVPGPAEIVAQLEVAESLAREVAALTEPGRTVVHLRFFEDLAPEAIAARTGVPLETVRTRLRRGLGELRARMDRTRGGERRAWVLALAPLARRSGENTAPGMSAAAAGGVFAMTAGKLAGGVAAAALAGWFLWGRGAEERRSSEAALVRAGDTLRVNFRLTKSDGSDWDIAELSSGRALVSGPNFNYQRVILEQTDLLTAAVEQADGSYTYTFPIALPATYLAPINDSPFFGPEDGELTGQALLDGTYTLGMTFAWDFTVDGESARESENVAFDFVIGNAGVVEPREVVTIENCNRCHTELRVHGGRREEATMCVLCHTAGAEDRSNPAIAGGTPGVSIDFKVMIHKIHAGEHLPSVQGVATNPDGSRDYTAPPTPYVIAASSAHDYSNVAFPAWPHALVATPRDEGYTALAAGDKAKEDLIRTGPSNCVVCHGDPDDDGPLAAPAQGDFHQTQPTRQACGSCHDDIHWGQNYTANGQTMPAQANNSNCTLCHETSGNPLAVFDAHLHPLKDPTFDTGLNFDLTTLVEAGTNDGDGTIDPGEKIAVTFAITDDAGVEIAPAAISSPSVVISGPTSNYNLLLNTTIPSAALTGAQPFTVNVPMPVFLERLGVATGAVDTFTSDFTPHWNVSGGTTTVYERTATAGGDSTLTEATVAPQNYVDVASAAGFARDDYVVVDDGTGSEEYARIQLVDGTRLWFSSLAGGSYKPGLALAHAVAATVREVTLTTQVVAVDYTLTASTGEITEVAAFGDGNVVLASYTTDFVLPATYPLTFNDGPDLGESSGEWVGKSLVDGTYSLGLWSARSLTLNLFGESNSYRSTSDARLVDFLVGSAAVEEPYALISSGSNCFNCHQELGFHGFGRRGFESCVVCHGTSGGEDRPRYVAANAEETPGVAIGFRTMLHKIHMGEELTNAASYLVNGFGSGAYPNNFTGHAYGEIVFPALPGGVQNCSKCHGDTNEAWHEPAPRNHPTEQGAPVQRWAAVCSACHDSPDALAHVAVQTDAQGNESCGVCHGADKEWSVERLHRPY